MEKAAELVRLPSDIIVAFRTLAAVAAQWLFSALAEAGLSAICVETRHMRAALKAQINKTDRNDARGIAQMMRVVFIVPCM